MRDLLKIVFITIIVCMAFLVPQSAIPGGLYDAEKANKHLGVIVLTFNGYRGVVGSGFAIKRKNGYRIVSAKHINTLPGGLEFCDIGLECVELIRSDAVGLLNSSALTDDWVYWNVNALPGDLKPVRPGSGYKVGDPVCASGSPLGRIGELSCGRITNLFGGLINVDARILPGNSGGPLLDYRGRVIGIVVAMDVIEGFLPVATSGFVVPISSLGL